jgi:hypothetical protein
MVADQENQGECRRILWQDILNHHAENAEDMERNCFSRVTVALVKNALLKNGSMPLASMVILVEDPK